MTKDKALEAAFRKSADAFRPDPTMFVCMDPTGCYHVSWNEAAHREKMATVGAEHEARYFLSALPGEAEDLLGQLTCFAGITPDHPSGGSFLNDSARKLVEQAADALRSLQARVEAAERERDEARTKALKEHGRAQIYLNAAVGWERRAEAAEEAEDEAKDCFWAIYPKYLEMGGEPIDTEAARTDLAKRAEAAEARVKEVEEAMEPFARAADFIERDYGADTPDAQMQFPQITMRELRRARTALKGGFNG